MSETLMVIIKLLSGVVSRFNCKKYMERSRGLNVGNYVLYAFKFQQMLYLLHVDTCVYAYNALKIIKLDSRDAQYVEQIFDLPSTIDESNSFDFI